MVLWMYHRIQNIQAGKGKLGFNEKTILESYINPIHSLQILSFWCCYPLQYEIVCFYSTKSIMKSNHWQQSRYCNIELIESFVCWFPSFFWTSFEWAFSTTNRSFEFSFKILIVSLWIPCIVSRYQCCEWETMIV